MFQLKLIATWLKQNWKVPFLVGWTIVVWALSRKNAQAALDTLEVKKESYDRQIIVLKENHERELSERDKLLKQYYDTMDKIEKEYIKKGAALNRSQKITIKKIVEQSRGNPDAVKEKIKDLFNIPDID